MTPLEKRVRRALQGRWMLARDLADQLEHPRRGMGQKLRAMERRGLVKSRSTGERPSLRSDAPPKEWTAA